MFYRKQRDANSTLNRRSHESRSGKKQGEQNQEDMDNNIKVLIFVESRYKVNRKKIIAVVKTLLKEQSVTGSVEVSIAVVGDRKMRSLNKKHRGKDNTTNVLSFSINEGEPMVLPTDTLRLGDVVISYPQIIREAAAEEMLVDDKVNELVQHGLMHLLGLHHE